MKSRIDLVDWKTPPSLSFDSHFVTPKPLLAISDSEASKPVRRLILGVGSRVTSPKRNEPLTMKQDKKEIQHVSRSANSIVALFSKLLRSSYLE